MLVEFGDQRARKTIAPLFIEAATIIDKDVKQIPFRHRLPPRD
jgi:hypothetical protein